MLSQELLIRYTWDPLPQPFPERPAVPWVQRRVPATDASARVCPQNLLPMARRYTMSLSLQIDIFYSKLSEVNKNRVEQFVSCKANSYDSVYHKQ